MKVALYFGSFNPIHHGHLIIASHILYNEDVDQIWFVVSPHNPFKQQRSLLNEYHRLHLTRIAIEGEPGFRICDIEFKLPRPSYTIQTLEALDEKYPGYEFSIVVGSDSFSNIDKWRDAEKILNSRRIFIYLREGFPLRADIACHAVICHAPLMNISASMIRKMLRNQQSIRYYVPENVREEIEKGHYYKS